jgi:hypothetical protein
MGAHPGTVRGRRGKDGGWAPMAAPATCRVKGCERPPFVGGLCGLHALQGFYRSARRGAAPALPRPPPA